MDGDNLSKTVNKATPDELTQITNGLADFTESVQDIVENHSGFLVYAGGDDVLALLPLQYALSCANQLRKKYRSCFPQIGTMSLSGAIEYSHIRTPLGKILKDSIQLLDIVAKDGCDRNALAVRVWKPGGRALEWAQKWDVVEKNDVLILDQLSRIFAQNQKKDSQFSNKFFFKLRNRFSLLKPEKGENNLLNKQQAISLLTMDYLNAWNNQKNKDQTTAKQQVSQLLEQCQVYFENQSSPNTLGEIKADAALLLRFLAQNYIEEVQA